MIKGQDQILIANKIKILDRDKMHSRFGKINKVV